MVEIGTPIPSSQRETSARGAGPVVSYKLSPDELSQITGRPIPGEEKPVTFLTESWGADKTVEASNKRRGPAPKEGPTCGLTKTKFLEAIASGETTSSIEKAWGMKYNTLYEWVKKWDLKGITMEKAAELIAGQPNEPVEQAGAVELAHARAAAAVSGEAAAKYQEELEELRIERDEWRRTANELTRLNDAANERIRHLEEDLDLVREPVIIEVSAPQPAGFISLRFPIIDTGEREISSRLKSLETIGGISGKPLDITGINLPRLAHDGLEVMQIIIGVVQAMTADIVEPADLERTLQQFFGRHNDEHVRNLRLLAEEHGWEVVGV